MKNIRLLFLPVIFTSVVGCKADSAATVIQPSLTPIASPRVTSTFTPSPTVSPTLTLTPTPTLTPTLTPTPTPILPVQLGTSLPDVSATLSLQNIMDIEELGRYSGNTAVITRVSKDNRFLVTGSTAGVDVFDLQDNSLIQHIDTYIPDIYFSSYDIYKLGIDENANLILVVNDDNIEVYSRDGDLVYLYPIPSEICSGEDYWMLGPGDRADAAISPDGNLLVVDLCEGPFEIISLTEEQVIYSWDGKNLSLHGKPLGFSPDGSLLATAFDSRLWIWQVADFENISKFPYESYWDRLDWAFSPDSTFIAFSQEGTHIWNIRENQLVRMLDGGGEVKFSDDSTKVGNWYCNDVSFAVGFLNNDCSINVWDLDSGILISEHIANIKDVHMSLVQIANDGEILINDILDSDELLWERGGSYINFLENQQSLYIQAGSFSCLLSLDSQLDNTFCLQRTSTSGGLEQQLYFWNGEKFFLAEMYGSTVEIFDEGDSLVSFTTNGNWGFSPLYFGTTQNVLFYAVAETPHVSKFYIRDVERNRILEEWTGYVDYIVISPDNRLAAFFIGHNPRAELIIYDLVNRQIVHRELFPWAYRSAIGFSPDSQHLVYSAITSEYESQPAADQYVYPIYLMSISDPDDYSRYELETNQYSINTLAFSADGSFIAVSHSNGMISIINANNGELVHQWRAHHAPVHGLSFSDDGRFLASISESGFISIWGIWP
ncbi:MAG: hypothetical protein FVQ83_13940 [Chloroflexi bacterium]|nr:hypothetical protein [Chloroflexota bacterium]